MSDHAEPMEPAEQALRECGTVTERQITDNLREELEIVYELFSRPPIPNTCKCKWCKGLPEWPESFGESREGERQSATASVAEALRPAPRR